MKGIIMDIVMLIVVFCVSMVLVTVALFFRARSRGEVGPCVLAPPQVASQDPWENYLSRVPGLAVNGLFIGEERQAHPREQASPWAGLRWNW